MTRPTLLCALLLCLAGSATAAKPAPPKDVAAVERWALAALTCRGDFGDEVTDRAWIEKVKALGVTMNTQWQEGDVPDGDLILPSGFTFGGGKVAQLRYWADSGAEFYAHIDAPPEAVAKALGTKPPVPATDRDDLSESTIGFLAARAKTKDERRAPGIFVRKAESGSGTEAGCRYFDG